MGLFSALMGNAGVVGQDELIRDYGKLLTEGEAIDLGFKLIRDTFIFTNKRMILVNKQGITGRISVDQLQTDFAFQHRNCRDL